MFKKKKKKDGTLYNKNLICQPRTQLPSYITRYMEAGARTLIKAYLKRHIPANCNAVKQESFNKLDMIFSFKLLLYLNASLSYNLLREEKYNMPGILNNVYIWVLINVIATKQRFFSYVNAQIFYMA